MVPLNLNPVLGMTGLQHVGITGCLLDTKTCQLMGILQAWPTLENLQLDYDVPHMNRCGLSITLAEFIQVASSHTSLRGLFGVEVYCSIVTPVPNLSQDNFPSIRDIEFRFSDELPAVKRAPLVHYLMTTFPGVDYSTWTIQGDDRARHIAYKAEMARRKSNEWTWHDYKICEDAYTEPELVTNSWTSLNAVSTWIPRCRNWLNWI
jgi:hypothetical protein